MIQELIPIQISKGGKKVVSARDLYEFLEIKSRFNDWIANRVKKYGFVQGQDFLTLTRILVNGGKESDHALTIDMAKELAMVEGNEKGKAARLYFIACEKMIRTSAPVTPSLPQNFADALRQLAEKVESEEKLKREVAVMAPKAQYADKVLSSVSDMTTTSVAKSLGMSAKQLNHELSALKVQFRVDGCFHLNARYQGKGYATQRTHLFTDPVTGEQKTNRYLVWTEAGKEFIHRLLNPELKVPYVAYASQQANA